MKAEFIKVVLACGAAAAPVANGSFALAQGGYATGGCGLAIPPKSAAGLPSQLTETRGAVQRFTLTPVGEIDGIIITDGTEVHLPPHLTTQIATAVKLDDNVVVKGYRSSTEPLVVAYSITDANTGQTVVDNGPPPPGSRPPPPAPGAQAPGAQQTTIEGKVQQRLYGPAGDINGALLDDGTIVPIGPREAYQIAYLLSPGQSLAVRGWGLTSAYGKVGNAQALGPTTGQMVEVAPPIPAYGPTGPPPR